MDIINNYQRILVRVNNDKIIKFKIYEIIIMQMLSVIIIINIIKVNQEAQGLLIIYFITKGNLRIIYEL